MHALCLIHKINEKNKRTKCTRHCILSLNSMEKIECSVCNGATVSRRIYRKKKYMYIHRTCIHSILFYTQNSCEQCWRNAFQFRYIHKYKICRDVYIAAYVNIIVFSSMYSKSSGKRAAVECTQHTHTREYIHIHASTQSHAIQKFVSVCVR